jgi:hypothetical protein
MTLAVGTARLPGDTARSDRGSAGERPIQWAGAPRTTHSNQTFRLPRCQTCRVWKRRTGSALDPMPGIPTLVLLPTAAPPVCPVLPSADAPASFVESEFHIPHSSVHNCWWADRFFSSGNPLLTRQATETGSSLVYFQRRDPPPRCGISDVLCPRGRKGNHSIVLAEERHVLLENMPRPLIPG